MTTPDDIGHPCRTLRRLPAALVTQLDLSRDRMSMIAQGRDLIAEGQPSNAVFLISEGWAISKMSIKTGDTQILNILGPGSLAGINQLDRVRLNGYSAIALQNIQAYKIDVEGLQSICLKDDALARWLSDALARRTQRTQRHLTALGQLPARGRLAFMMLRILEVAQQSGRSAVGDEIHLPMTQEEIGNMLGLTNVSISKLMSAFRKDGLIDYSRNRIVIHDVTAISDICGMEMEDIPACDCFKMARVSGGYPSVTPF